MKQEDFEEDDFEVSSMEEGSQSTASPSHTGLDSKSPPGFPPNPSSSSHSEGFGEDDFEVSSTEEESQCTASPLHTDLDRKIPPGFPPKPSSSSHSTPTSLITATEGDEVCVLDPTGKNSIPESIPTTPLVSDLIQMGRVEIPEVVFYGWGDPGIVWEKWVTAMAREEKYVEIWRKAGIEDAIMGSVSWIIREPGTMEALMGFWCQATRSFVMPWGEITFTLEDAYVLGNFPIRGGMLQRKLTVEEERLKQRLVEAKAIVQKGGGCAPKSWYAWLSWFKDLKRDDGLRHLAFLAYWLGNFVFPSKPPLEVSTVCFGLAARLGKGERLALAPSVLANMYRDLSYATTELFNNQGRKKEKVIEVWAPFHLLQAWIWEHFVKLRPKSLVSISRPSKILLTRFDCMSRYTNGVLKFNFNEAVQILRDERSFSWRPYADELDNWVKPEWYTSGCKRISVTKVSPDWVHDFLAVLSCADLVGFPSEKTALVEKYKPHRVARQLGYDQAIPGITAKQFTCWGLNKQHLNTRVEIFMPRMIKLAASLSGYVQWWNEYVDNYIKEVKEYNAHNVMGRVTKRKLSEVIEAIEFSRARKRGTEEDEADQIAAYSEEMKSYDDAKGSIGPKKNLKVYCREKARTRDKGRMKEEDDVHSDIDEILDMSNELPRVVDNEHAHSIIVQTQNHGHSSQAREGIHDLSNGEQMLLDELEEFKRCGLLNDKLPNFHPIDSGNISCNDVDNCGMNFIEENGDSYGEEVIKKHPQLFKLIPQHPHYRGLLQQNFKYAIKRGVYLSVWKNLLDLMRKGLSINCQTSTLEIEQWIDEAQELEILGFDVRHITAHLKVSRHRLQEVEEAKIVFEKAKRGVEETEKSTYWETRINELEGQRRITEIKLEEIRKAITSAEKQRENDEKQLASLREKVEDAEKNLRAKEHDVESRIYKFPDMV